jgi:transcriptional regulator with XRE-family HTH domain
MLKIMENETEIFTAWLRRYLKKDKVLTGKKLASLIGCFPSTITSYLNKRTSPDFKVQAKIQRAVNIPRKKILEIGRHELNSQNHLEDRIAKLEAQLPSLQTAVTSTNDIEIQKAKKNARHHEIIDQFKNHKLATEINIKLVELEQYSEEELKGIQDIIDSRLKRWRKKMSKKKKGGQAHRGNSSLV